MVLRIDLGILELVHRVDHLSLDICLNHRMMHNLLLCGLSLLETLDLPEVGLEALE